MTTHADHDHPNTKAGRAACRRNGVQSSPTDKAAKAAHKVKAKDKPARRKITEPVNTSLPHTYEDDIEKPDRCFVCGLTKRARVHDEPSRTGNTGFVFDKNGKLTGLRLW